MDEPNEAATALEKLWPQDTCPVCRQSNAYGRYFMCDTCFSGGDWLLVAEAFTYDKTQPGPYHSSILRNYNNLVQYREQYDNENQ